MDRQMNCQLIVYTQREKSQFGSLLIPVRHDMMRQTNDCSPVQVMQHKVNPASTRRGTDVIFTLVCHVEITW